MFTKMTIRCFAYVHLCLAMPTDQPASLSLWWVVFEHLTVAYHVFCSICGLSGSSERYHRWYGV